MNKLLLIIVLIFLTSCGVKGNLYLPPNKQTMYKNYLHN
ncbi:MAG: lipoprotein [Pseudomonadota bacterium]